MKRKIAVVTGTRAEYGIFVPVLKAIELHQKLELSLIVTGMHLSKEFGYTIREIEKDGFKIDAKVNMLNKEDTGASMARSVGKCLVGMVEALELINPDVLLLLGDRGEILASAIASTYMNIPIAHIHGGEVSGSVDEPVRHAITKLSHIHFVATDESANRIIKMGENPSSVFVVGAPRIDTILSAKLDSHEDIKQKHNLDLSKPILLVIQHPVTTEANDAARQIRETLDAILELKMQTILIYPNADAGGRRMIQVIKEYEKYSFIKTFKSLPHEEYLSLMKTVSVMVGNSSSGIIESSSFKLPVVNIGTRQERRERAENVIDVNYNKKEIVDAIKKVLYDQDFKEKVKKCKNPYGDGKANERIVKILSEIEITPKLLQKRITY